MNKCLHKEQAHFQEIKSLFNFTTLNRTYGIRLVALSATNDKNHFILHQRLHLPFITTIVTIVTAKNWICPEMKC